MVQPFLKIDMPNVGKVLMPGDPVNGFDDKDEVQGNRCTVAGRLLRQQSPSAKPIIATLMKKYIPSVGDIVIGRVRHKRVGLDAYEVDIRAPIPAFLPFDAFPGASRRHFPNLESGDVVLCIVALAPPPFVGGETMVTCIAAGETKGWGTGEAYLGPLATPSQAEASCESGCEKGMVVSLRPVQAVQLLWQDNPFVLARLGTCHPFEVAIGVNGLLWVRASSPAALLFVARTIQDSVRFSDPEIEVLIRRNAHKYGIPIEAADS